MSLPLVAARIVRRRRAHRRALARASTAREPPRRRAAGRVATRPAGADRYDDGEGIALHAATATRRAGRAALVTLAAYGVARAVADWRGRRAPPQPLQAPARALVDEAIDVANAGGDADADHAYYEWRADLLAHADEMQPPVDE